MVMPGVSDMFTAYGLRVAALCLMLASPLALAEEDFASWLQGIRVQALEQGITPATLDAAFDQLEPDPRVLGFDRKQPEFVQTFEEYLQARVTPSRVNKAREYYATETELLKSIASHYAVDPQYLLAFWGLESSFGNYQGKYQVIRSLATLAYDPRRRAFFTRELIAALKILDEGHVQPTAFLGGWAGAMGQNQFMPSSFLNYAQDFDGDGKKNIWADKADVWASIAYYLQKNNWQAGETWGLQVNLSQPVDFSELMPADVKPGCRALRSHTQLMSLAEWAELGITPTQVQSDTSQRFAMVVPDADETVGYLVGPNFRTILAYNCANKYAVSIGLMADRIVADPG